VHDLQEAADDEEVLEKVDHLVLIGEVAMEENRRRDGKGSEDKRYGTDSKTEKQKQAASTLNYNSQEPCCWRKWKTGCGDHCRRRAIGGKLTQPAHEKHRADEHSASKR
jgi:hypothetical protein